MYSGTEAYEARLSSVYSPNARLESWCIYQPTTAKETAIALRALADTNCCSIGVRSGGHGIWTGANYIADGVTIDFGENYLLIMSSIEHSSHQLSGNLNSTSYNEDTGIASIEPGTNWGTVYQSLQEFGVTVAGGRTPGVGVGGFLTGGGISFYSGMSYT